MARKPQSSAPAKPPAKHLTADVAERLITAHLSARDTLARLRYEAQQEYKHLAAAIRENTAALKEYIRRADFLEDTIRHYTELHAADQRRVAFLSERLRTVEAGDATRLAEIARLTNALIASLDGRTDDALRLCPELAEEEGEEDDA